MAEIPKVGPERTKRDMLLNAGQTVTGFVAGGLAGGGIAHLVGNAENQVGVGFESGVALAGGGGGFNAAIRSHEQAREYALLRDKANAIKKTAESIGESIVGFAAPAGVLGHEIGQIGTTKGLAAGILMGLGTGALIARDIRRNYREGRHVIDFSKFGVKPVEGYPERYALAEIPPVFMADSFAAMQEFRNSEREYIAKRHVYKLEKPSDKPREFGRDISGLFFIRGVSHFPVQDPDTRKVFKGLLTEKDQAMNVRDEEGTVIRVEPPQSINDFWPWSSSLRGGGFTKGFSWDAWKAFRDESWKNTVLVLAQYRAPTTVGLKAEDITDQYWLVSLYDDEPQGKMRRRSKKEKEERPDYVPTPVFQPAPHILHTEETPDER